MLLGGLFGGNQLPPEFQFVQLMFDPFFLFQLQLMVFPFFTSVNWP
jgi:hypothetical protein